MVQSRSESDACRHALIPSLAVSAAALVDRLTGLEVSTVLSSASESAWLASHLTSSGYKHFKGRRSSFDRVPLECIRTSALLA